MSIRHTPQYDATTVAPAPATAPAKALAVLRIATGLVFLWAFLDKLSGLGYATPTAKAWINGGSPTKGFLSSVDVGPFDTAFHAIAGTVMMLMMWLAEFPPDRFTTAGEPSMSTNPLIDYHVIYAIALIVIALTYAGNTWGLGQKWAALPIVQRQHWTI